MSNGIYQATTGALLQQYRLDILSNNLANVNTVGFKEDRAHFEVIPAESSEPPDTNDPAIQIQPTVSPGDSALQYYINFAQGPLRHTGNPLDLAIEGNGFFNVQTPDGVQYTRKGNFMLAENGQLVTQEGYAVLGQNGTIELQGGHITIGRDGSISVNGSTVDVINVTQFSDPQQLLKTDGSFFILPAEAAPGEPSDNYDLMQGYLELANVDPIKGMVEMIEALRVFEAYQKMLETLDNVDSQAVAEVGTVV